MNWFHEVSRRSSAKNGIINVSRSWGMWRVVVDGCGQTTAYTNAMWKDACRRIARRSSSVRSVCMLGLGGAGSVSFLHKTFPGCTITAVEYDPEMISIAKTLGLYRPFPFPEVIEGDAAKVVPQLDRSFDLIICDLFNGPEPSTLVEDAGFLAAVRSKLTPEGIFVVNVFRRASYLDAPKNEFQFSDIYRFKENSLGLFWDHTA